MMQFKGKNIKAIRHVATPSISFNYRPDFGEDNWGYYKTVQNDVDGNTQTYSIFGDYNTWKGIYGAPPSGKYGVVNFGLTNNLEMKVANKKDEHWRLVARFPKYLKCRPQRLPLGHLMGGMAPVQEYKKRNLSSSNLTRAGHIYRDKNSFHRQVQYYFLFQNILK